MSATIVHPDNVRVETTHDQASVDSQALPTDAVARVARKLLPQLDGLVARSLRETREREPAYRTLIDDDDPELGRCGVAFVLHQLAATEIEPERLDAPEHIGRLRAEQGVPLEAVLHAFRIDFHTVWDAMLALVRQEGDQASRPFLHGVTRVWETIDTISVRVSSAYRETESAIVTQRRERRDYLLGALLNGPGSASAVARKVANEFSFNATGAFVLVVVQTPADEHDPLSDPELALSTHAHMRSAWLTDANGQHGLIELRGQSTDELIDKLRPFVQRPVGISPEFRPLAAARDNLWLAELASHAVPAGSVEIATTARSLPASFVAAAPELAQHTMRTVLAPLEQLPADERARLLTCLDLYIRHSATAAEVADRLHIHRNTLFGYLRRIAEVTGKDPHDRHDLLDLALAMEARRIYGSGTQTSS